MYRLNWYQKFSEYQLVNFWNTLATKNADKFNEAEEILKYKKTFYLLLLLNAETVGFSDKEFEQLYALKTPDGTVENFQEFMNDTDPAFYDYEYNFDGMSYEDFKTNLKRCATVADIRNIATKYGINVPKRLKKEELVALVVEGLRRQGKYDASTDEKLKKMSAITLQRFAKVNGINASTEMKKADVVDYVMNNIEASTKAVRKPRIELVSIPELTSFQFSKEYLRDVNIVDEEDSVEEVVTETIVDAAPVVEAEPVVEAAPVIVEEPVVEETPVVEDTTLVEEEPIIEEESVLEAEPVLEEEIMEQFVEEKQLLEEDEYYEDELIDDEEEYHSPYNDELLSAIVRLLEERDRRDVVNEVLEDTRFNSMVKLYEERIAYLEKMISDMRSTPIPINIQVTYPNAPVAQEVVANVETEILEETPEVEVEAAPETVVSEEVAEEVVEEVSPIVLDSTFDGLSDEEKASVVKAEMKNADKVEVTVSADELNKASKKQAKKLKKYDKKRAKYQKIRDRNDMATYKKNRRKKFRKFILTLFLLALLAFVALVTAGALVDFGKVPANVSEVIEKYLAYIPPFAKDGAIRNWCKDTLVTIFHFVDGLLGKQ